MYVSQNAIDAAVLRIFRDFRVFHAGGTLLLGDLRNAWSDTGLRGRDLPAGVASLESGGCLKLTTDARGGDVLVALTPDGAARITGFPHRLADWLSEIHSLLTLRSTARRQPQCSPWSRWRRHLHGLDDPNAIA